MNSKANRSSDKWMDAWICRGLRNGPAALYKCISEGNTPSSIWSINPADSLPLLQPVKDLSRSRRSSWPRWLYASYRTWTLGFTTSQHLVTTPRNLTASNAMLIMLDPKVETRFSALFLVFLAIPMFYCHDSFDCCHSFSPPRSRYHYPCHLHRHPTFGSSGLEHSEEDPAALTRNHWNSLDGWQ